MASSTWQGNLRLSKPVQDMPGLQSTRRTLLDYEKKEDELASEMAELQSEIDKIDAQEEKVKQDEAEIEDAIEEEEEYLDELTGGELPNNGENGDAENNINDVEKNDEQDGAFVPTKHQMYLAYQKARADIECDDARAEVKKDQQEEETESGNKAGEEAIEKDMEKAEEEIAKECVEKKNLMQKLVKEAEAECDWDKDEQECELVNNLLDLVENAKEDIGAGEVGVWPKTDVIDEGQVLGKDKIQVDNESPDKDESGIPKQDENNAPPPKSEKVPDNDKDSDATGSAEYYDNDVDIDLASLESELKESEEKCTKARLEIPAGFELKTENAEEIQAVNEECCLGPYVDDDKCQPAIPKEECNVFDACTEAKVMADQLHNELDNNLDIAEAKCREGAKGILVEKPGKTEGAYDNLDDLDIIRMTCCLAPYDTDMVYCQDKAQVAQVRTNNRCNLLEFCLEANHLVEKQTETKGDAAGQVGRGDDDKYKKLSRDDDTGKEPSGVASPTGTSGNNIDDSSHDWSATVWLALVLVVLISSILLVGWKRRKSRKSTSIFGERRFSRGSMPSHDSSRRKSWDEDAEYGLSDHAARLSLHHEEDTTSFAPAIATSALYGSQGFS